MTKTVLLAILGLIGAGAAPAQQVATPAADMAKPDATPPAPADYRQASSWLCRPGTDDGTCSADLDAVTVDQDGTRTPRPFRPAADPKIDCFYIYPTASQDRTMFSDMVPDAAEKRAVHAQAARLREKCRLFVPIYHQFTIAALHYVTSHPDPKARTDAYFDVPYRDVAAAWAEYLAHDNKGRGVVIVGHSQGAILAKRLIAEQIDDRPARKLLVGAYLAGNLDLAADSFRTVAPCKAVAETGCFVAWSSYRDEDRNARFFGGAAKGHAPVCVNPAAPGGGRGMLDAFLSRPGLAPASDPPYVEVKGQLSAECVTDAAGAVLRIRIEPSRYQGLLTAAFDRLASDRVSWGLHPLDISLVQGNMLAMIGAQTETWLARK